MNGVNTPKFCGVKDLSWCKMRNVFVRGRMARCTENEGHCLESTRQWCPKESKVVECIGSEKIQFVKVKVGCNFC